jgi:hypothetical protein
MMSGSQKRRKGAGRLQGQLWSFKLHHYPKTVEQKASAGTPHLRARILTPRQFPSRIPPGQGLPDRAKMPYPQKNVRRDTWQLQH